MTSDSEEEASGRNATRRALTRRSGRVRNKPKYSLDEDDSPIEEEEIVESEKKTRETRKRKQEDDEEEAYELSEEEESEISEEYEEPSESSSTSEYAGEEVEEEEWDRRRRRFVSVSSAYGHPSRDASDLPPFLAEAVNRTAANRPMDFAPGALRPSSLSPEQIQEIVKNTVSTLATVNPITGRKLPMLLPRAPVEQAEQIKSAVSEELKQSITSLLMDPATREAMIKRLQGASAVSQRATMAQEIPRHPLPPPRPLTHLAPRKIVKTPVSPVDAESYSATRPRRAAATKKIDYSTYFKEDEDEEMIAGEGSEEEEEEEQVGVEKILSYKKERGGRELFYIKYWGLSYLHCEWVDRQELEQEKGMATRIKKFLSKPVSQHHFSSEHIFNPDFVKMERIVYGWTHEEEESPVHMATSYLVKWTGLPYEDATWEKEDFVLGIPEGREYIEEYKKRPNVDNKRFGALPVGRRPDPSAWKPFDQSPEYKDGHLLRPYQLEGVNWLVYCWMNKQSCIIADEMGLGKTVQSVAFLDLLYKKFSVRGPFLIVCPLSTLPHWQREFEAWTDLNVIVYHGSKASRDVMFEYEFFFKNIHDQPIAGFTKFDVMITTYEMAMAGIEQLLSVTWRVGVFDEAHRLKNRASKAADVLKGLEVEHKILLSGTPIQNSILELWSLLNFLQPQRFYSEEDFMEEFGDLGTAEDVERLQDLLKPLMLRRLKEDVEKSIPVKEETIIEVELTPIQKRYYRAILEKNFAFLTQGCTASNSPNLLNAMMELRKCCIHPFLIKGSEERIMEELGVEGKNSDAVHHAMIQASGKLVLVDKLLKKLREGNHRVLIFSQMTRCLDILGDYLKWRGYPSERIDGAIKGSDRQAAIDRFCDLRRDAFAFLLCTRAGGVGINLTAADTVVIFDSDWNPQNDLQAQARCHRIGQTRAVKIYRLITRNTYERDMFDRAGMKLGLDRAVLQKMVGSTSGTATPTYGEESGLSTGLSRKEVETLLKKGAYGVLMETTDDAANQFCEEDIDQILERRATVIRHDDQAGGPGQQAVSSNIFSKASFTATAADDFDIDIDDPNFWELWAKKLEMNPRALLAASSAAAGIGGAVDEPRVKRLIKRLKNTELVMAECTLDETVKLPGAKERKQAGKNPLPWTESEIKLLQQQLALHGIGRFSDLPALFPARSKNDIIAGAKAIIKGAIESVARDDQHGDDEKFKEDAEKAILWKIDFDKVVLGKGKKEEDLSSFSKAEIPYPGATVQQCLEFKSFTSALPTVTGLLDIENSKKLLLRIQVMEMVRQIMERHEKNLKAIPVPGSVSGAPMPNWWGRDADVDLIIGTFRFGYNAGKLMQTDPQLIFSSMQFDEGLYEWPSDIQLDSRLRKLLVNMEKRAQVASKLAQHQVNLGERRRTSNIPSILGSPTSKKAAAGTRKRKGRIVSESESSEEEEEVVSVSKKGRTRRSAADAINELRREALAKWTTKERNEFHRILCLYGLPKTISDDRDVDDDSPFFKGEKRDWSEFRSMGEFEEDKTDARFNEWCEEYLEIIKSSANKAGTDEPELKGKRKRNQGEPKFPKDKANKALHSIDLFGRLRSLDLDSDQISKALGKARRSAGLPKWWVCEQHDLPFLLGAANHGLADPSRIVMDKDLPFINVHEKALEDPSIASNATATRRSARNVQQRINDAANVVGWPNEAVAMRRIEYLLDLIESGPSIAKPKKKKEKTTGIKHSDTEDIVSELYDEDGEGDDDITDQDHTDDQDYEDE